MGYFVQVLKLACVATLWGLALGHFTRVGYGVFVGVLVFYLLLVIFVGTTHGSPRV
jgi:hypothetical protein